MRHLHAILAAMFLSSAFLANSPAADKGKVETGTSPKGKQQFFYYVPATLAKDKKAPLILSYHGAMGKGSGEIGQWTAAADKYGWIIACPTSDLAGARTKPGQARRLKVADFTKEAETALSIVTFLKGKFAIDDDKIMVTGFSGGGHPAFWLGFTHPEVFRYVVLRSANFPTYLPGAAAQDAKLKEAVQKATKDSRIYFFYGEKDHPILLGEAPKSIGWLQSLKPTHLKVEKLPAGGHSSRADLAVAWFAGELGLPK